MVDLLKRLFGKKRQYRCFVFLCDQTSPALWQPEVWASLAGALQPVIDACDGKPHIKVDAWEHGDPKRERTKLGRLSWDAESFKTWNDGALTVYLVSTTTPSFDVAEKSGRLPDMALYMTNITAVLPDAEKVPHRLFLAVAEDVMDQTELEAVVSEVEAIAKPDLVLQKTRPWGYLAGSSDNDTATISDYSVVMPMYNERQGEPIGDPQHGWKAHV